MDRAIFFDFDGTLVDVADRFHAVYGSICRRLGIRALAKADYWQARQQGRTTRAILARTDGEAAYDAFIAERSRLIEDPSYLRLDTLRDGAGQTLAELSDRHPLHLVSLRSSRENLLWQLEALGLRDRFAGVWTASAFGTFEDKARLLAAAHARPGHDVVVGDTEVDIQAGQRQGLYTCAVLHGMRTEAALRRLRPDHVVAELGDLVPIVAALGRNCQRIQGTD